MTRRGRTSVPALDVLLGAVEQAQDELLNYLDPNSPTRSAEATIDKLTQILDAPEVLDAMMLLGLTPPWLRPDARKPSARSM